ncbi:hypothetical protein D0U04_07935 [Bacillus clarus]|uniref:Uncharacterized protein n=1 Tax=Bacillus clarus TaxID=2338372 RepID=A0A090YU27_9BACI|nr:hypothetical protein [Bacillus clarus]KFN01752.1 hypothetical protein DJ93_4924 [Bacillus clarus]RFT67676.1 hypothetical protein D0U04_07935 [Bacillus clarus]
MKSIPYFPKNSSCQRSSITKNEELKIKNSSQKEILEQLTKTNKDINLPSNQASKQTMSKVNKTQEQVPKSNASFPFQINIPYFNIHIDSTELLTIAKSVLAETLLRKFQDPKFLMDILNSEGGNKLLNLAGNFFNNSNKKTEENNDGK